MHVQCIGMEKDNFVIRHGVNDFMEMVSKIYHESLRAMINRKFIEIIHLDSIQDLRTDLESAIFTV